MDLNSILQKVASGKIDPSSARALIEKLQSKNPLNAQGIQFPDKLEELDSKEGFKTAFDRLKKAVHIDELLKISSGIVNQIAENMPNQIEKFQENISASLPSFGFSANNTGVESRLSLFRTFHVSDDSQVAENNVVGSQWFGVNFAETAEVKKNKFTAVQFSEVSIVRSNLCSNTLSLSRLSNVTLQEARFESNRISRTTFSDVSITEADFTNNKLVKSEFAQTVLNGSRLSGNEFSGADFTECEFDECDIQGVIFENCTFRECTFHRIEINSREPVKISNCTFSGKTISNCKTVEKLLASLESNEVSPEETKSAEAEDQPKNSESYAATNDKLKPQNPHRTPYKPRPAHASTRTDVPR